MPNTPTPGPLWLSFLTSGELDRGPLGIQLTKNSHVAHKKLSYQNIPVSNPAAPAKAPAELQGWFSTEGSVQHTELSGTTAAHAPHETTGWTDGSVSRVGGASDTFSTLNMHSKPPKVSQLYAH